MFVRVNSKCAHQVRPPFGPTEGHPSTSSSPVTLNAQLRRRIPFALNLRTSYSESEREGRLQSAERAVPTQFANDTTNLLSA